MKQCESRRVVMHETIKVKAESHVARKKISRIALTRVEKRIKVAGLVAKKITERSFSL